MLKYFPFFDENIYSRKIYFFKDDPLLKNLNSQLKDGKPIETQLHLFFAILIFSDNGSSSAESGKPVSSRAEAWCHWFKIGKLQTLDFWFCFKEPFSRRTWGKIVTFAKKERSFPLCSWFHAPAALTQASFGTWSCGHTTPTPLMTGKGQGGSTRNRKNSIF